MRFLSLVGNSFGCSASGERLVSAARDGDLQEAKALLDYNPRLARYSTFGVRNSPLHYSAAQGHHEIVSLLVESGVDINLRNYRGQTALMQACQHGHWEVVLILILFGANIHRSDYLNGGTALHLAALNGHPRCIRILLSEYIPSVPNCWSLLKNSKSSVSGFDPSGIQEVINRAADGGITPLHVAALNGHVETVQLLLDLGASLTQVTVEDGTTIDLIGAGSTPLHYASCGGNTQCCQVLIDKGASLAAINSNGWTPLMVARSWHRNCLEEVLNPTTEQPLSQLPKVPSPFLCLPLMSIVKIAQECGWRGDDCLTPCRDPCAVCLERKCTVAADGCGHEFCTNCALYLSTTNITSSKTSQATPGSVPCPLCRYGIVSFTKLPHTIPTTTATSSRTSISLSFCTCSSSDVLDTGALLTDPHYSCKPVVSRTGSQSVGSSSFRSLSCRFPPSLCLGGSDVDEPQSRLMNGSYSRSGLGSRRSTSEVEGKRSWFCALNHCVTTGGSPWPASSLGLWGSSCKRKALEGVPSSSFSGETPDFVSQNENAGHPRYGASTPSQTSPNVTSNHFGRTEPMFGGARSVASTNAFHSVRNTDISSRPGRRLNPRQPQESVAFSISLGGTSVRPTGSLQQNILLNAPSSVDPLDVRSTAFASGSSSGEHPTNIVHHPALTRNIHQFSWDRGSGSSGVEMPQWETPRSNPEQPTMFAPPTDIRNPVHDQSMWSFTRGSPVDSPFASRGGPSSAIHGQQQPSNPAWIPPQSGPIHNPTRASELSPWSLFPSIESQSASHGPLLPTGPSLSSNEAAMPSSSNSRSHRSRQRRSGLLSERQNELLHLRHLGRSLAADSDGRNHLISEIRQVLSAMRRGESLRIEDYMVLDPLIFQGMTEMHDRHREMRLDVDNMSYEELLALGERIGDVSTGLSEDVILKTMKQHKCTSSSPELHQYMEPCCICQEEYAEGDDLGTLECGHEFHKDCIKQWVMLKNLCPICKTVALTT